jgi:hypothetical protein
MTHLYQTDGRVKEIRPSGAHWTLEELQGLVGGYIGIVRTTDDRFMVINEMGKVMNPPLDLNIPATRLYVHGRRDVILGPAVVVDNKLELDGPDDDDDNTE